MIPKNCSNQWLEVIDPETDKVISEWEKFTNNTLTLREKIIFQFGYLYGQTRATKDIIERKVPEGYK